MNAQLSHSELQTRARKVRAAAADRDLERLHRELDHLLDAFVAHADREGSKLRQLPSFSARLVRRGQERVLDELIELSLEAEAVDGSCRCEQLGTDIAARLEIQADAERRAFMQAGIASESPGLV